jgi:hypothetical protein
MLARMESWWNQALIKQGKDPLQHPFKKTLLKFTGISLVIWLLMFMVGRWVILPMEIPDGMYLQLSQLTRVYPALKQPVQDAMIDGRITVEEYMAVQRQLKTIAPGKPALQNALRQ